MTNKGSIVSNVVGIILAGGEGRRMGYQNKGLLPLAGKPMIAHVIEKISTQVDRIYISANDDLTQYRAFNLPVIKDEASWSNQGPLAGIASVLRQLSEDDIIQVVSCDGPMIPDNLVATLSAARIASDSEIKVVYPETGERGHYLYLQGQVKDLQEIEKVLAQKDFRIRALLAKLNAKAVLFTDEDAFLNCNSPEDIERLEEFMNEKL